jgi:class 3 adenylate cyclase
LSRSGELETWEFDKNNPHRIDRTTVVGRAALTRAPAHIPDVLEDPEYTYGGPRIGYRARVERQRTELARFVSPQVAELLSSDNGERLLAGHRAYITVLFCDLRGFTAFAETAAPERFGELAALWRKRGTELGLGIGIAAGYATLGRIGFEGRYDYGALGPVTNLASRLSTEAKSRQILISQRVCAAVEDAVRAQPVGELELKGFGRPVPAYEVRALQT